MEKLKINKLANAVVIKDGLIQCITTSKQAIKRALASAGKQGHPEAEVKDVIVVSIDNQPGIIDWQVYDNKGQLIQTYCTRKCARDLKKSLGEGKIVRKEYLCISSEVVS